MTGRPPFTGSTPIDVMMQQADKPPPAPSSFVPGLHAGLELSSSGPSPSAGEPPPERRRALASELAAILPELATAIRRESVRPTSPSVPPRSAPTLPGVPNAVAITSDEGPPVSPIPADRPPDTQRSTTQAATRAEETPPPVQVVPAQASVRISKAEALAVTVAEGAVWPAEPAPPSPAAATAATPPPPAAPAPAPPPQPAPLAPAGAGHALVPPWVFAVVTTILVAILVLVRYLRFR